MRETYTNSPDEIESFDAVSDELRSLRKQRARYGARIAALKQERQELMTASREKLSIGERLRIWGERAYIYTEIHKLEDLLNAVAEREQSYATRYAYIAPLDELDLDESIDQ